MADVYFLVDAAPGIRKVDSSQTICFPVAQKLSPRGLEWISFPIPKATFFVANTINCLTAVTA